jgi:hypothetical protein
MSNVKADRFVINDWWTQPIPANVTFGEGFYCESAQIFRHLRSKKPGAIVIGNHVSCYAGCSFAIGENGRCTVGDFTLLNGALIMAEEKIAIGSYCLISWGVGLADSDFHPLEPAQRLIDAQALAPFFKDRPPRPTLTTAPKLGRGGGRRRHQIRSGKHSRRGKPSRGRENIRSMIQSNAQLSIQTVDRSFSSP